MIGKVNRLGSGFRGIVSYLETGTNGKQRDRVEWIDTRNLPTADPQTAACIMRATADLSVRTQKPVYHLSISFDPADPVNRAAMRAVADRVLDELGLSEHQALLVAHKDTAHPHVHVVVNRVHPEHGRAWSNSWDYLRIERSLRTLEVELGLRRVPGKHASTPEQQKERASPERAPRMRPVRGDAAFLREVRGRATPLLETARSWAELERGLAELGLSLRVRGGGLCLSDGEHKVKASEVGRSFSRGNLEKRLGRHSDYRARIAVASATEAAPKVEPRAVIESPEVDLPKVETRSVEFDRAESRQVGGEQTGLTTRSVHAGPEPSERSLKALSSIPVDTQSAALDAFLQLVEQRREGDALQAELRSASEARQQVERWGRDLERADEQVRVATRGFATELRGALRDPRSFSDAFGRLSIEQKRRVLQTLRDRPDAFARELLDGLGAPVAAPKQDRGWRAVMTKAVDRLTGRTAAHYVFRNVGAAAGAARLTAIAGEYYLDSLRLHDRTRARIANDLGLPDSTFSRELKDACRSRARSAELTLSHAQARRDAVSDLPSRRELARRYLRLPPPDRMQVRSSAPATGLMIDVLRIAETMARGPEPDRGGPGL